MADKKDNKTKDNGSDPAISTSSSLEQPLQDGETTEIKAEIDTSHLSVEDAAQTNSSLEEDKEQEAPAIDTSYLSLEEDSDSQIYNSNADDFDLDDDTVTDQSDVVGIPLNVPPDEIMPKDEPLYVSNPLAENTPSTSLKQQAGQASASSDSSDEEQLILTTGISDEDFDNEMNAAGEETNTFNDSDDDDDDDDNSDNDSPIKSILNTVKKPESIVRNAWLNSSVRRFLIENFDSYRAKDEDQNMEAALEKLYGGVTEKKFDPKKFFRENLLFSFLVFLLIFLIGWKAAGILFPDLMPGINDQIIDTVKNTASIATKTKPKEEKKIIVTNEANKLKIEATLSHCLLEPDAHTQFSAAFTKVGYEFSEPPLTLSYDEVNDSIKVWGNMNMGFYIKDAILRFNVLSSIALPAIQEANKTVSDYNQSLIEIRRQTEDLENRIRSIQTSRGNQSTYTINERIPLRIKLDELNARLAAEPSQERFTQLLEKLALLENILSGKEIPTSFDPGQVTEYDPEWLLPIAETDSTEIGVLIEKNVIPSVQVPADKLKNVYPKLTAFHLTELDKSLDNVLKLSALIFYLPENILIPYKLELSGLNRRLNKLMKQELPEWLNYNRCLATTRAEALGVLK